MRLDEIEWDDRERHADVYSDAGHLSAYHPDDTYTFYWYPKSDAARQEWYRKSDAARQEYWTKLDALTAQAILFHLLPAQYYHPREKDTTT